MFEIFSLLRTARGIISRRSRRVSRRAYVDRQSLQFASLAVHELEARIMPTMLGQQLFPSDYPWNQNIAGAPVAANSANIIAHIGNSVDIHPDWGTDSASNGTSALYGIPYNVVHGNTTTKINVVIDNYPGESDIVAVPIPANAVIEGDYQNGPNPNGGGYNANQRGDSHLLVWDEDTNTAYELYGVTRPSDTTLFPNTDDVEEPHTDGLWHAAQESDWHMSLDQFRTLGDTSADAAGLSILAGLVRPDEGLPTSQGGQGAINHALRFTLPSQDVSPQYIYPASHVVNESANSLKLPLGSRLRLANTPAIDTAISKMGPEAQIIATAMQQYGLVLADIGSAMYVTGTSASQTANNSIGLTWNMSDVLGLTGLNAGDFQVLNLKPIVSGLSTSSGSAGSTITINGQNFSGAAGNLSVLFGTVAATNVTYLSDSQITAVVPSGTGTVNVTVQSGVHEIDPDNPANNVNNPVFGYGISVTSSADLFTFSQSSQFAPPTVKPGLTGIYTALGLGVNVDSTLGVTSSDTDITGASLTISSATRQTGDTLSYTIPGGYNISATAYNSSNGTLSFSGSDTPAHYQAVLRSVQFSSTNGTAASTTARNISIVATDTNASGSSTPISETLFVNPVLSLGTTGKYTAGSSAAVAVDPSMTVWSGPNLSSQNNVTGAVISLTNHAANDLLAYTIPVGSGISVVGSGYNPSTGVLSFTGNSTAANYQALLRSVSFSNTVSSSTTARNFTFQVSDSLDDASSGGLTSNALGESLTVSPPVTVAGAWVNGGSSWSAIDTYFGSQNEGSATNGWALQTGANQLTTLPWTTINTVVVQFSGTVNKVALGSLELVGGTLGTIAPTSLATLGTNTYAWTFGSDLVNQQYVLAIATTGSSFGTTGVSRVVDSDGAGISGKFTTSSSAFPSGNGLAGSTFDFAFNVLPGDADRDANDNSNDALDVKTLSSNTRSTAGNYNPFYDLDADGTINSNDVLAAKGFSGRLSGSTPNAPSASQVASPVGADFTALALGVLDSSGSISLATGGSTALTTDASSTAGNGLPTSAERRHGDDLWTSENPAQESRPTNIGHPRPKFANG